MESNSNIRFEKIGSMTSLMVVLLFFAYPLSALLSLWLNVPSTIVNIVYRALIVLLALLVIFILILNKNLKLNPLVIPIFVFLILYLFRIVYDTLIVGIETTHPLLEIYTFYLGNIILPFIAIILSFRYVNVISFVKWSLYVLLASNFLIIITYFNQIGSEISPLIFLNRATILGLDRKSDIINPISFGLYGGSLLLFCMSLLLLLKDTFFVHKKLILRFGCFLGLINLVLGNSRGPLLFTFLGIIGVLYFYFYFSKFTVKFFYKLSILMLFSFVLIVLASSYFIKRCLAIFHMAAHQPIFDTFNPILSIVLYLTQYTIELGIFKRVLETKDNIESGDKEERNLLYTEAIDMFVEAPLFGNQMNLKTLTYPHNLFLEVLLSTGIIGMFFFLIGFLPLLLVFFNFTVYSKVFCAFIPFFILIFGISMTTGNLYQNVVLWNLMGIFFSWPKVNSKQALVA